MSIKATIKEIKNSYIHQIIIPLDRVIKKGGSDIVEYYEEKLGLS